MENPNYKSEAGKQYGDLFSYTEVDGGYGVTGFHGRNKETIILLKPLPTAWNKVENSMPSAAGKKHRLMVRRAGTPLSSIFSEALKICRKTSGIAQNSTTPIAMISSAIIIPILSADISRLWLRAP